MDGWEKRGCLGLGMGKKNGAFDPEHGTGTGRSLHSCTKGGHPKYEDFFVPTRLPDMH